MIKIIAAFLCLVGFATFSTAMADTPLELSMKKMSKAYKQLALDLTQPQEAEKADYLKLAGILNTEAQKSRGYVPKKAADLPVSPQTAMVKDYQKSIDDLGLTIHLLTVALQDSKWDEANKQMAQIKQQMMDGHKAFRKKEGAPAAAPAPAPAPAVSTTPAAAPTPSAPATN